MAVTALPMMALIPRLNLIAQMTSANSFQDAVLQELLRTRSSLCSKASLLRFCRVRSEVRWCLAQLRALGQPCSDGNCTAASQRWTDSDFNLKNLKSQRSPELSCSFVLCAFVVLSMFNEVFKSVDLWRPCAIRLTARASHRGFRRSFGWLHKLGRPTGRARSEDHGLVRQESLGLLTVSHCC